MLSLPDSLPVLCGALRVCERHHGVTIFRSRAGQSGATGSPAGRSLARRCDALERRASRPVRTGQDAQTHQELAGDLAPGDLERALEQLHPRALVPRTAVLAGVCVEPLFEDDVRTPQATADPGVVVHQL